MTNEIKSNLIYGGDQESLNFIDVETHEIIDIISIGNVITSLDTIYSTDGQVITLIGCINGEILIRKNFEILNKKINICKFKTITCLKFCQNYNSIIFSTSEGIIYFLINHKYTQRKIKNNIDISHNKRKNNIHPKNTNRSYLKNENINSKDNSYNKSKSKNSHNLNNIYKKNMSSNEDFTEQEFQEENEGSNLSKKNKKNLKYQDESNTQNYEDIIEKFENINEFSVQEANEESFDDNLNSDKNSSEENSSNSENEESENLDFEYKIYKTFSLEIGNGYPISITFDENYSKALFLTNKSKLILLNLNNFQIINTLEDISTTFWNNFEGFFINNSNPNLNYNHVNLNNYQMENLEIFNDYNNRISFAMGNQFNFIICSDFNNNFFIFKDYSNIHKNKSVFFNLHSSHIQNIKIRSDDKMFVTFGYSDKMICEWSLIKANNEKLTQNLNFDKKNSIQLINNPKNENINLLYKNNSNSLKNDLEKKIFYYKNFNNSRKEVKIHDTNLINELNYCNSNTENYGENDLNKWITTQFSKKVFLFKCFKIFHFKYYFYFS